MADSKPLPKPPRRCGYCKDEGHDARKCPSISLEQRSKMNEKKRKKAEGDKNAAQPKRVERIGGGETKKASSDEVEIELNEAEVEIEDDNEEKIDRIGTNPFVDGAGGEIDEQDEAKDDSVVNMTLIGAWQTCEHIPMTNGYTSSRSGE